MKRSGRMKVGDERGDHGPGCDCAECRLVYGDEYMDRAVILDRRGRPVDFEKAARRERRRKQLERIARALRCPR